MTNVRRTLVIPEAEVNFDLFYSIILMTGNEHGKL